MGIIALLSFVVSKVKLSRYVQYVYLGRGGAGYLIEAGELAVDPEVWTLIILRAWAV